MDSKIRSLSQEIKYIGRILNVIHRRIQFSAKKIIEYEVLHRSNIAIVVPLLPSGDIVLIKQFRASIEQIIWEFPAGSIEAGESPLEAAKRELAEETGYAATEARLVRKFYTAPHFCDEEVFVFIANVSTCEYPNLQEKEVITSHVVNIAQLNTAYQKGEIIDAKTIIAYHALLRELEKKSG
jgi:ADP-ribose pyrophosphatase